MFLEVHIILIIPREDVVAVGSKGLPNLTRELVGFQGWKSFGEWKYIPERNQYECTAGYMDCFAGQYRNYFAEHDIYWRPSRSWDKTICRRFRNGWNNITDPMTAAMYMILQTNTNNP